MSIVASSISIVTLDEASHVYTHADGHRPPSVTSILKCIPPWNTLFDRADPERLEYRRELGTQVHRATHFYDEGTLDIATVDPVLLPYLLAWQLFRMQKAFTPIVMETAVYHAQCGYAGTLDRIGVTGDRETVLVDIKTGDGSMAGPQTEAYCQAFRSMPDFEHLPLRDPIARWSVQLLDTGRYALTVHNSRADWRVFLAALEIHNFNRRSKR